MAGSSSAAPDPAPSRTQSSSQSSATPTWILVAHLIRPHGRRGEIIADILTDFPERFHTRTRLFLIPPERIGTPVREVGLENFWFMRSRIVLKFQGIDSINDAESLRNFEVAIPAAQRAPLEGGSVYTSDLLGCRVYDLNRSGAEVGEIIDIDRGTSSTDLLVVRIPGARGAQAEALIPFVQDYMVRMAVEERRIEMRLPEGLLAINAPLTEEEKRESHEK
jgi:16S rRNA processing protein RimM